MAAGYENYREKGGLVGRKEGFRKADVRYKMDYFREIDLLEKGNTLRDVRAITGTSINTLRKLKAKFAI